MVWDILFNRKRTSRAKTKEKDEVDVIIEQIEAFAPKDYRSDRDSFYYNYRIMGLYKRPLLALLETILKGRDRDTFQGDFGRDLFFKLKDFYDPKDRLSPAQALEDVGLLKKFREIFLFFYGSTDLPDMEMKAWL
jgi:hypothetical protein